MKYHIWIESNVDDTYVKMGELTPAANDSCCWFGNMRLWSEDGGYIKGQFRIVLNGTKYWIVSDDEMTYLNNNAVAEEEMCFA